MSDDDYLWDKSGSDPAVKKLERTLGGLAFDRAAPKLPETERRGPVPLPRRAHAPARDFGVTRGRAPLAIAAGLGMLAAAIAYSAIKKQEADVRRGWNLVTVVVASTDIPEGSVVSYDMVAQRAVPEQFVTSSVVKPESASYVVNQKVLVPVQAGDPLLWSQFESTKSAERLSTRVSKQARAITVEANKTSAVGGWVRPNDHVDLIGSFKDPQTNESVAVTLMQNVIVLATGKITGTTNVNLIPENQRDYTTVSLMVIPEEAEVIALATELGALTMTLRNEDDVDVIEDRGRATLDTLLSGERTRVLQQKRFNTIQVIRGAGSAPVKPGP